jgi:FixJ family two-component response regulator
MRQASVEGMIASSPSEPAMPTDKTLQSIAVVDDDDAVRRAVSFALQAEDYAVDIFADAATLLAFEDLGRFACFVVDLKLPDRDGLSVIEELRRTGVRAPAILVTTQPDPRCRQAAQRLAAPIVEKPLMGDALSEQIRRMVEPTASR